MILFGSLLAFPVVVGIAAFLAWGFARLALVPERCWSAFFILCAVVYGLFYLGDAAEGMVVIPRQLQKESLGEVVAGPGKLVAYEAGGFQDPYEVWRYVLTPAEAARLRPRCKWTEQPPRIRECILYYVSDDEWGTEVKLEGDTLQIVDGAQ